MADTVSQLVTDVLEDGGFDATEARVLRWLDLRHREMVVASRCYRKSVEVATVADQRDYTLEEEIVEIYELKVNGLTYGPAWHSDLAMEDRGFLLISDASAGLFSPEESTTGAREFALIPTPEESDLTIEIRAAWAPDPLLTSDDSTLKIPQQYTKELVDGAIGLGYQRDGAREDLATPFEMRFNAGVEKLRREMVTRYKGTGATTIRVRGINA